MNMFQGEKNMQPDPDLNPGLLEYRATALTTELFDHLLTIFLK
jgi:hypothetical protein